ncbi:MAG: hypothetical protein ACRC7N_20235, partial [Clostridium sp.]
MKDVTIINQGLTGIVLAALLSRKGLKIRVISSPIPKIIPFYQNDIENGVMSKVAKVLEEDITSNYSENKLIIRLGEYEISLGKNIGEFKNSLIKAFPNKEIKIEEFFQTIAALGEEWKQVISNEFIFDWKKSKNSIRFSNFSYKDYLNKIFLEEDEMKKVLLSIAPVADVSLNTMAGYLYTQVFDGCNLIFGIRGVIERCLKIIGEENIIYTDKIKEISAIEFENIYEINLEGKIIKSKLIVDTRERKKTNEVKYQNEVLSYLSLEIFLENERLPIEDATMFWSENVYSSWEGLMSNDNNNPPFIIWNEGVKNGGNEGLYRIDIIVNKDNLKETNELIIEDVLKKFKL